MTIRYKVSRADVWQTYWRVWRNGWKLKGMQAVIAVCVFYLAFTRIHPRGSVEAGHIAAALGITIAILACLPLYPIARFKPEERVLGITPEGIDTNIGKLSAQVPWKKIESVVSEDDRIYVIGKNQNAFVVPDRAFSSSSERAEFLRLAGEWLAASKTSAATPVRPNSG